MFEDKIKELYEAFKTELGYNESDITIRFDDDFERLEIYTESSFDYVNDVTTAVEEFIDEIKNVIYKTSTDVLDVWYDNDYMTNDYAFIFYIK
jgi:adenylosuccinate synthase